MYYSACTIAESTISCLRLRQRLKADLGLGVFLTRALSMVEERFFITKQGFMGVGPPALGVGDRICVLFRGSTPFVLRLARSELFGGIGSKIFGDVDMVDGSDCSLFVHHDADPRNDPQPGN